MRCSHSLGHFLIPHSCFWWLFLLCIDLPWSFVAGNDNSSTYQYIYNLTICELNGTEWLSGHFAWAAETFVLYPVVNQSFHWVSSQQAIFLMRSVLAPCPLQDLLTGGMCSATCTALVLSQHSCVLSSALPKIGWLAVMPVPGLPTSLWTTGGGSIDGSHQYWYKNWAKLNSVVTSSPSNMSSSKGLKLNPLTRTSVEQWEA
uniref:Envelope glycoprotein n=1 Tax=Porcine reproductive and respiratory syndrome virus TaxID=28344 RepID=Q8QQT9_PRRSV|nr:envelope glycoprotein [Porcine reproductive and respiratory syndrome virus]